MNVWLLFLAIGGLTLVERLSFTLLLDHWQMPVWASRALRFVPVTILSALVAPAILRTDGAIDITLANPKLLAAVVAVGVVWRTRSLLATIAAGMVAFWIITWLIG